MDVGPTTKILQATKSLILIWGVRQKIPGLIVYIILQYVYNMYMHYNSTLWSTNRKHAMHP